MSGVIDQWEESKQKSIKRQSQSFTEHRFYSAVFTAVVALYDQQATALFKRVTAPDSVSTHHSDLSVDSEPQNVIKVIKHDLTSLAKSIDTYRRVLDTFLVKEDQLCLLNLTPLKTNSNLYCKPLSDDVAKYIDDSLVGLLYGLVSLL